MPEPGSPALLWIRALVAVLCIALVTYAAEIVRRTEGFDHATRVGMDVYVAALVLSLVAAGIGVYQRNKPGMGALPILFLSALPAMAFLGLALSGWLQASAY